MLALQVLKSEHVQNVQNILINKPIFKTISTKRLKRGMMRAAMFGTGRVNGFFFHIGPILTGGLKVHARIDSGPSQHVLDFYKLGRDLNVPGPVSVYF